MNHDLTLTEFDGEKNIILAPTDPALWPAFREKLAAWRNEARQLLNYDDSLYSKADFAWASSSYVCYFLMMYDELFYDAKTNRYTVAALLEEGDKEFGGYDSVVLWHAYPRIGVDDRNQFDFYRDMPGGLSGIRDVVHQFQQRGLRVYINYNPWDRATRREKLSDVDMLAEMVRALDVDGIFLDTMARGGEEFRDKLDAIRPGVILEGEVTPPIERICDHHASWAQWFDDSEVPGVLRHKWFERRHMQHQTQRWNSDHSSELHTAWMNGTGMMVWENVFGAWVPMNARDRSLLRAMLPIQRRYTAIFSGEQWTPLVPVEQPDVYAFLWEEPGVRLWTLVNRSNETRSGILLQLPAAKDQKYFDLIAGRELLPHPEHQSVALTATIPPRGLGCVIALPSAKVDAEFKAFLAAQSKINERADHDTTRPRRESHLRPVSLTKPYTTVPAGMLPAIFNAWTQSLATQVRARECGFYDTNVCDDAGFRYSYFYRINEFIRPFEFKPYAFDETPVTNAQFAEFLTASSYRPQHPENFLKHWIDGKPPAGKQDHPVVWVDLGDARAYAAWAGKRLPTEADWQYAAQGGEGREYPWGNCMRANVCNLGENSDTTPVKQFPDGRALFGGYDFCGNVWQWTESEQTEGRTRFCMIRGGSYYAARGSLWYVDGGPRQSSFATKFLLMWPGLDRCGTIGFRCVVDMQS
jgi:hypothetical protein